MKQDAQKNPIFDEQVISIGHTQRNMKKEYGNQQYNLGLNKNNMFSERLGSNQTQYLMQLWVGAQISSGFGWFTRPTLALSAIRGSVENCVL